MRGVVEGDTLFTFYELASIQELSFTPLLGFPCALTRPLSQSIGVCERKVSIPYRPSEVVRRCVNGDDLGRFRNGTIHRRAIGTSSRHVQCLLVAITAAKAD